jgi:hypothetical protein
VILQAPRLLLSTIALAIIFSSPSALFSQAPVAAISSLPDEPRPQSSVATVAEDNSAPLVAEAFSSSVFPTPEELAPQTTPPPQDHPLTDAEKKAAAEVELKKELKQRMGGIVPNFNAVLDGSTVPLTPGQKMRAAFRSAIDPYQVGLALFTSGIGQAEDSHDTIDHTPGHVGNHLGYRQGWEGYGKRFGASFTDQFDGTIIGNGVLPVLLHQDARYFRMGTGSFKKRLLYSMSTTIICRGDNGKRQPNYSNVLGNIAAGGISNLYYPAADRGFGLTIEQGLLVTAEGTFGALLIEFYPDIKDHFAKGHHSKTAQPAP